LAASPYCAIAEALRRFFELSVFGTDLWKPTVTGTASSVRPSKFEVWSKPS
jgi:hypothetical protein